jgi:hypothetical protein
VLPQLTPATGLGERAVAAYSARAGIDVETFLKERSPLLTAQRVGEAILELATSPAPPRAASMLTAAGLTPAP